MGVIQASHTVEIDAPRERVYEVAADVANCAEWQPSVKSVEVIETDDEGNATKVKMLADAKVKETEQLVRFSYDKPGGMNWEQEKGDVKSLNGSWNFTSLDDDRTKATYDLRVDPGRMLGMLMRGPVEGQVKKFLAEGAAEGLKSQVEGSG